MALKNIYTLENYLYLLIGYMHGPQNIYSYVNYMCRLIGNVHEQDLAPICFDSPYNFH